ncbi:MAG TPA: hypothetical protein VK172_10580 [Lentimicrobium sp.]|nr:hypothetical protein [Lentimicrobium sp.]
MGWTQFRLNEPVKDWFKRTWEEGGTKEVLDCALVKRSTMYGAIRVKETGEVFCAVFLIRWSREYYNFSYKDMTEHSGPCERECPLRIMKLLTPLKNDDTFAKQWREDVYKFWEQKKIFNATSAVIKTKEPVSFTNGQSYQYFKKEGRRLWAGEMRNNMFFALALVRVNLMKFELEKI